MSPGSRKAPFATPRRESLPRQTRGQSLTSLADLRANPDVTIEADDETIAVHATELTGVGRDQNYRIQSERYPGFAAYQQKTSRKIPVIALTRRNVPEPDAGA